MHLLEGLFFGMRDTQTIIGERERLLALGSLSAGLTHELNNPAGAAVRATSALRDRVAGMRHKLAMIADGRLDGRRLHTLVELQEEAVKRAAPRAAALPDGRQRRRGRAGRLAGRTPGHRRLGPGRRRWSPPAWTPAWLEQVARWSAREDMESAVRWLSYTLDTEQLMAEIDDAVTRISTLVGAAKQYSQLDRAPHQVVDVHDLLDATLVMFKASPAGVRVVTGVRPGPAAHPGVRGRTEPGVDEPDRQRASADGRGGRADAAHRAGRRPAGRSRSPTPDRAFPGRSGRASSNRSSPPRASVRAPGWGWTSRTGSWSTSTTATSGSTPGDTWFQVRCRCASPRRPLHRPHETSRMKPAA